MSYSKEKHLVLTKEFMEEYTLADLKSGFEIRVKQFFIQQEVFLKREKVPVDVYFSLITNKKNLSKTDLAKLVSIVFLTEEIFKTFRASLEKEVQQILDVLVWELSLSQDKILEHLGIEICDVEERRYSASYAVQYNRLKKPYSFFKSADRNSFGFSNERSNYTLYLPLFLRKHIALFYKKPKAAKIIPLDNTEPTAHIYDTGQQDIFLEIQRILAYHQQGQIKYSKRGKVQASTLGKMQRKLNLKEFYPTSEAHKSLKTLRTGLIASLIVKYFSRNKTSDTEQILKKLMHNIYPVAYESILGILTYLKGSGTMSEYYINQNVETQILDFLHHFPHGKWVSVENIIAILKYNFIEINLVTEYAARSSLYYEIVEEYDNERYYKERLYIESKLYDKAITEPLLKGSLFLFAAFGLLDVAFDRPDLEELGTTAYSPYDGLKFIRINDLGAYLLKKIDSYTPPETVTDTKIKLSEDSLTIISDKNNPTAAVVLEPYTQKVSANRFRTDANIFLKSCNSKRELQSKIALFKQSIAQDLPANWLAFFKDLENKIDPITLVNNVSVFKIPKDNHALIQLIAKDEAFRSIVMKAEGYQILVEQKNLLKFKQRLREYGYLLSK